MNSPPPVPNISPDVEQQIEYLRGVDLNAVKFEEVVLLLRRIIRGYWNNAITIPENQMLYRANRYDFKPDDASFLTYPPAKLVTGYQRANTPGNPMFYTSMAKNATLYELDVKPKDRVSISMWKTTAAAFINNIAFDDHVFAKLKSDRLAESYALASEYTISLKNASLNRVVRRFFADEFSRKVPGGSERQYIISAALTECFLGNVQERDGTPANISFEGKFAGILYPSLAMRGNADNLVLLPDYADRHCELVHVEFVEIDSVRKGRIDFTEYDFANSFSGDGLIRWKGRPKQYSYDPTAGVVRSNEGGDEVYRDAAGNMILPN